MACFGDGWKVVGGRDVHHVGTMWRSRALSGTGLLGYSRLCQNTRQSTCGYGETDGCWIDLVDAPPVGNIARLSYRPGAVEGSLSPIKESCLVI